MHALILTPTIELSILHSGPFSPYVEKGRVHNQVPCPCMSLYELEEVNHICGTLYEATHMTLLVKYILDYEV